MTSSKRSSQSSPSPTEFLLSLTVAPMLLGLIASRSLLKTLEELGQASEELFRGDRLPPLNSHPETTGNRNPRN